MSKFNDPMALLRHQQALFQKVEKAVKDEHAKFARGRVTETERDLLSGGVSTRELRNMGHPFARKRFSKRGYQRERLKGGQRLSSKVRGRNVGAGISAPLLPINKQDGTLAKSVRLKAVPPPPGGQAYQMGFTAPYAKYVLAEKGTKRMVARGFVQAKRRADKRANKALQIRIQKIALRAAVTGRI